MLSEKWVPLTGNADVAGLPKALAHSNVQITPP
jgi:hypothetical protein